MNQTWVIMIIYLILDIQSNHQIFQDVVILTFSDVLRGRQFHCHHRTTSTTRAGLRVEYSRFEAERTVLQINRRVKQSFFLEIMNLIQLSRYLMVSSYIQDEIYDKNNLCLTRRFIYKTVLSPPNLLYPKPRPIFRDYEDLPSWISNGFIIHLG